MKRTTLLFLAILMVLTIGAKPVKTRLKISNASSKSKIEYAARHIYGVTQASYDASTRILVVTYDNKKTNTSKVRAGIKPDMPLAVLLHRKAPYNKGRSRRGLLLPRRANNNQHPEKITQLPQRPVPLDQYTKKPVSHGKPASWCMK